MGEDDIIPTYVINLKKRIERKKYISKEFKNKTEFKVEIVEAIEHEIGTKGLWQTIIRLIHIAINKQYQYILICEDDHKFTKKYSKELLLKCIIEAQENAADVLSGGVSYFSNALKLSNNLFWVDRFTGGQFIIIFRKFYTTLLDSEFKDYDVSDFKISFLSQNKFFIAPFISVQKDFGYSDATLLQGDLRERTKNLFNKSSNQVLAMEKVRAAYKNRQDCYRENYSVYHNILISTYIICSSNNEERLRYIKSQFIDRPEFDIKILTQIEEVNDNQTLQLLIREIIQSAINNNDDVIIICKDQHQFTNEYSKEYLLKNIFEAHTQGVDYLSGGSQEFELAVPVSSNRYWVRLCLGTEFIVVYKKFFNKILEAPLENLSFDLFFSSTTNNKMLLYPFISGSKNLYTSVQYSCMPYYGSYRTMERIRHIQNKYELF